MNQRFWSRRVQAPLALLDVRDQGGTRTLLLSAGTRRAWKRAARATSGGFVGDRVDAPTVQAVAAALKEGGSLLETYAVRRATRRLLRSLGDGRILSLTPTRVLAGVTVLVDTSNLDGSAKLVRLSYAAPRRIGTLARSGAEPAPTTRGA